MKAVSSVLLMVALVPLSACAPKANDPADVQAIKAASLTGTRRGIAQMQKRWSRGSIQPTRREWTRTNPLS